MDWLRGLVMVLMTIDHSSGAFNRGRLMRDSVWTDAPGTGLPAAQFFTRWMTHLCAMGVLHRAGLGTTCLAAAGVIALLLPLCERFRRSGAVHLTRAELEVEIGRPLERPLPMHVRPRALAFLMSVGASASTAPHPDGARLEVVDAAEGCAEFWRRAPAATPERQARAFEQLLRAPHPTLYTAEVLGLSEPFASSVPERLTKASARFRPDPARVDEVRRTLDADLQRAAVQFRKTFPEFHARRPVFVVCSLGAFDGGTRPVNGAEALLFGPDVIAAIRPRGFNLRPFLEHELFHVHHGNLHPGAPETIVSALWEEGLATYVSAALKPGASNDEVSVPDALILGSTRNVEVPARSGYLIGWRIDEGSSLTSPERQRELTQHWS